MATILDGAKAKRRLVWAANGIVFLPPSSGAKTYDAYEPHEDDPGVMIAVKVPDDVAKQLAVKGGNKPEDMHCTLVYLGRLSKVEAALPAVRQALADLAPNYPSMTGVINGLGRFGASESSDGKEVIYATLDCPGLTRLRQDIVSAVEFAGAEVSRDHDFTPHITLSYVEPGQELDVPLPDYEIDVPYISLVVGGATEQVFGLGPKRPDAKSYASDRPLSPAERRVDFAAIKRIFDTDAAEVDLKLRRVIKQAKDSLLELVRKQMHYPLTAEFAQSVKLSTGPEFAKIVEDYLLKVWRKNRDLALNELPEDVSAKLGWARRYHLPGEHDQESHGNWADGMAGDVTETPAFKAWFGDSKVVDENGKPLVVYHGTNRDLESLDPSKQRQARLDQFQGEGFFFTTDPKTAAEYADAAANQSFSREIVGAMHEKYPGFPATLFENIVDHGYEKGWAITLDKFGLSNTPVVDWPAGTKTLDLNEISDIAQWVEGAKSNQKEDVGDEIRRALGMGGRVWLPDDIIETAARLGLPVPAANIIPVYLKASKVLKTSSQKAAKAAKSKGYDAVLYTGPGRIGDAPEWIVFKPEQVKSKFNRGTFNPRDPRISYEHQDYASSFSLDVAGNYFFNRSLMIKGLVDDELTKQVKLQIFQSLLGDSTLKTVMDALDALFEPWIGTERIEPSGISRTPEDILKPYRLENIVRTETANAMNMARKAVGEAADDFIIGWEHSSILDERTSLTCDLADGVKFSKSNSRASTLQPPLHFSCRSVDLPVFTIDEPVEWTPDEKLDKIIDTIPKGWIK